MGDLLSNPMITALLLRGLMGQGQGGGLWGGGQQQMNPINSILGMMLGGGASQMPGQRPQGSGGLPAGFNAQPVSQPGPQAQPQGSGYGGSQYTQAGTYPQTVDFVGLKPAFGSAGHLENPPSAYTPWRVGGQTLQDAYNANHHGTPYGAWGNPLQGNTFMGYNTAPTQASGGAMAMLTGGNYNPYAAATNMAPPNPYGQQAVGPGQFTPGSYGSPMQTSVNVTPTISNTGYAGGKNPGGGGLSSLFPASYGAPGSGPAIVTSPGPFNNTGLTRIGAPAGSPGVQAAAPGNTVMDQLMAYMNKK